ncbi:MULTISPECIES: O-antigen ligase family protein [Actinoalloteichus]|uniref:O-antigen ligase like membrane protein n=1 Tax=Actinoalloteichus fjordicus TaxID=1612552 RepID=A0AAC9LK45_9PSEU|nr:MULTISPECIES: O-antigen ligase family protein [Actinoalloteichus]APU17755.1 O-antigen ligase like membrane protein [Actinoalloteichus fjordicus]APU23833.1 O-antigen ligase like membrane protein [Actinoalloteichus sp. GBA129-24]
MTPRLLARAAGAPTPAGLVVVRPALVLAVFALALALPQTAVFAGVGGALTPARLVACAALGWWLLARFAGGLGLRTARNGVRRAALLFLLLAALAHAGASARGIPDELLAASDRQVVLFLLAFGVLLLACDGLGDLRAVRIVLGALVLGVAASAGVAIVHFGLGVDLRPVVVPPGLVMQGLWDADLARGGLLRAMGLANHPIELAGLCALVLPPALYLTWYARHRLVWRCCCALLVLGALTTISRTALLGIAVVAVLLLPVLGLFRWALFGTVLAALLGVAALSWPRLSAVLQRTVLGSPTDNSVQARLNDYAYVSDRLAGAPLSGQGFGTYLAPPQPYLDNQYLLTSVESGLPGLVGLVALLGATAVAAAGTAWRWRAGRRLFRGEAASMPAGRGVGRRGGLGASEIHAAAWAVFASTVVGVLCLGTFDALAFPQFLGSLFLLIGVAGALLALREDSNSMTGGLSGAR